MEPLPTRGIFISDRTFESTLGRIAVLVLTAIFEQTIFTIHRARTAFPCRADLG